jgi:hypothetical protein
MGAGSLWRCLGGGRIRSGLEDVSWWMDGGEERFDGKGIEICVFFFCFLAVRETMTIPIFVEWRLDSMPTTSKCKKVDHVITFDRKRPTRSRNKRERLPVERANAC